MTSLNKEDRKFRYLFSFFILAFCWATYELGFNSMVQTSNMQNERLRDFTYPLWDSLSFLKHGFLVFMNEGDYEAGIAYSNHSTFYLFFMNIFYKLEMLIPVLSLRLVSPMVEMLLSLWAVHHVSYRYMEQKIDIRQWILILLASIYFITMPTYWISSGKFNVDNPMHFLLPFLIFISYWIAFKNINDKYFWLIMTLYSLSNPIPSVLTGIFILSKSLSINERKFQFIKVGIFLVVAGCVVYMQPIIVSNILGFSSKNSGWLFRSGLDGDMEYYSNVFYSVFEPFFVRPSYLIFVPILFLFLQLIYKYKMESHDENSKRESFNLFMQIIISQYVLILAFWPQAVSIHPYLYDDLLLIPIAGWIILNFSLNSVYQKHFTFWFWNLIFLVTFNLTQIAQAAFSGYPHYPIITK